MTDLANIKSEAFIQIERLDFFLKNNQLVQANAISSRIEQLIRTEIAKSDKQDESHPLWYFFRSLRRCQNHIINGTTDLALIESDFLIKNIMK